MDKKRIQEEMARLDSCPKDCPFLVPCSGKPEDCHDLPAYTEDLNAVHRVLCGLDEDTLGSYDCHLQRITDRAYPKSNYAIHKATAAQWCEAILRATGKWEE